ncbi:MAG: HAD-IIIA family hydrolase [Humidesulfovibrio sp.]|uniref:KdsC family phosphatase n=1 Tax=Humidesulfovibrio sp. TaxID=2910988 RepID=UPI002734BFE8|nr:HAD-IIIA family hydrolase [Humidesulfovibrio sp.]MDP2848012.1 HAD-IIIA family hydrolase [Humidesulfovibrio sp.]
MPDDALLALGSGVKLLILDVDGVLTDGGLYYDHEGNVTKRFNVQDGLGIKIAQSFGLDIAVITGLKHRAVELRVQELGITEYHAGHVDKVPLMDAIRERLGLERSEVAYLGDDWVDVGIMGAVGLPMAVPNAQPEIFPLAKWVSRCPGGQGAVREAIMFILRCRGQYDAAWEKWS